MNEKNIRILLCDDHELFRSGIIELLKNNDSIFIIGQAENGLQMVEKYFSLQPDLVIADISMPQLSGFEAAKEILKRDPAARILLLTMHKDEQYIYYSYSIGIKGLLNKDIAKGELLMAIKKVYEGHKYFGPSYPETRLNELIKKYRDESSITGQNIDGITAQEEEILNYVSEGLTSSEIGDKMYLSKKTIDAHRQKIMQRFNLKSLSAFIKFAIEYTTSKKTNNNKIEPE